MTSNTGTGIALMTRWGIVPDFAQRLPSPVPRHMHPRVILSSRQLGETS